MVERKREFFDLVEHLEKQGTPIGMEGGTGKLKRPPQGFADIEDEKLMDWLKRKSFVATQPIAGNRITSPKLVNDIVEFGKTVLPFMQFVWRAVDPIREEDGNA